MEFNSIPFISFMNSIHEIFSTFSCFFSHPLFSTIVALYTLILLYAPSLFLRAVLSPVLNSTGIILLFLLKLGANERWGKDSSSQETRVLDSSANERLEKESDCSEQIVIDHKDKHYEKLSNNGGNLTLCSSLGLESTSLEQRFLDLVNHNQTNILSNAKVDLGFGSIQTNKESKPNSSLDLKSTKMSLEHEHDLALESNSQDNCYKGELIYTNSMKSSQVVGKGDIRMEMDSTKMDTTIKFLEWNIKAPLEIIYEAYEGEEEEEEDSTEKNKCTMGCERYPSLLMYYPESETDSSSDDDFSLNEKRETHESVFFKWKAEEDEREELIEISLDHYENKSIEVCQDEEDNLIEIDIFPREVE